MTADGSPPVILPLERKIGRACLVSLATLLLASCSTTTDPFTQLGLVPPASDAPQMAQADTAQNANVSDTGMYFIVGEDDPDLPDQVSAHPTLANGADPVAVAYAAEAPAGELPPARQTQQAATAAPAVDDAVLATRMGSNGAYLETVSGEAQPAPAIAAPEPKKKRGLFASLFGAPEQQQRTPRPVAQPAPTDAAPPVAAVIDNPDIAVAAADPDAAPQPATQPTAYLENRQPEAAAPTPRQPTERKRGFLSSLFGDNADAAPAARPRRPEPPTRLAAVQPAATASATARGLYGADALPGVRSDNLFEIKRKSGLNDDSDIDINEGDDVQVAMMPGLARLAPNGLLTQTSRVDVGCLKPSLVRVLKTVEQHYGKKIVVTSGYRSPSHNKRARGARNSLHMYCAAADIQVDGVTKWELAQYMRSMPGRGGVGTYCYTKSVHVDVGPERDWNWRCRRRKKK